MTKRYSYTASLKSSESDEPINTYVIRPLAGIIVWVLYPTPVSPNQVTIASTVAGVCAAWMYTHGTPGDTMLAGLLVTLKDILDSADGQLARARQQYSRRGRFLDSLGDALVNVLLFAAIAVALSRFADAIYISLLAAFALLSTTLRISYHVYYHTAFLHLRDAYLVNRLTEEIREEDLQTDRTTLALQRLFQIVYGWQDRLVARLDRWCLGTEYTTDAMREKWYGDRFAVRLSGFLGMGTEMAVLALFSLLDRLEVYLAVNVLIGNAMALVAILYRRIVLRRRINPPSPGFP